MIYTELLCMAPFRNVILTCDRCGEVSTSPNNSHVVTLDSGETICKPCFQKLALVSESVNVP